VAKRMRRRLRRRMRRRRSIRSRILGFGGCASGMSAVLQ